MLLGFISAIQVTTLNTEIIPGVQSSQDLTYLINFLDIFIGLRISNPIMELYHGINRVVVLNPS